MEFHIENLYIVFSCLILVFFPRRIKRQKQLYTYYIYNKVKNYVYNFSSYTNTLYTSPRIHMHETLRGEAPSVKPLVSMHTCPQHAGM